MRAGIISETTSRIGTCCTSLFRTGHMICYLVKYKFLSFFCTWLIFLLVARAIPNNEEVEVTDLDPTITYADDKSPVLPLVDLKILPPKVVTELLEAFVKAVWSKLFIFA
jgi:hypothetical protein